MDIKIGDYCEAHRKLRKTIQKDELFHSNDMKAIWQKYCGFLDLTVKETMEIQEELLLEGISLIAESPLGKKILGSNKLSTLAEFRNNVQLTTYADYSSDIGSRQEDPIYDKPS